MAGPRLRADPATSELEAGFARIRTAHGVPAEFGPAATAEGERSGDGPIVALGERANRSDLALVTVDPPGSRDLDQAFGAERRAGGGYRVWYAIADVAAFVVPGGPVDAEAHRRGVTRYSPDSRAPLYPPPIGERAASLLPDAPRPAVLWCIDLDASGAVVATDVRRAVVHSRAQLTYADAQRMIDDGSAPDGLALLPEIGRLREEQERARGGVDLDLPDQEVEHDPDGRYRLAFRAPLPVEGWNAQISLLTGMEAARLMLGAGIGLLRTLPPASKRLREAIGRSARALGVPWTDGLTFPEKVRAIDRSSPAGAALLTQVARTFRGAGYLALPAQAAIAATQPATSGTTEVGELVHAGVAAPYAHVTAPLRRLADRAANEVVLAIAGGRAVADWAAADLPGLPDVMAGAHRAEADLHRAFIDFAEAVVLRPRLGETFSAGVTDVDDRGAVVQIAEPAVLTRIRGAAGSVLQPGTTITVRLESVDPDAGSIVVVPVGTA